MTTSLQPSLVADNAFENFGWLNAGEADIELKPQLRGFRSLGVDRQLIINLPYTFDILNY